MIFLVNWNNQNQQREPQSRAVRRAGASTAFAPRCASIFPLGLCRRRALETVFSRLNENSPAERRRRLLTQRRKALLLGLTYNLYHV